MSIRSSGVQYYDIEVTPAAYEREIAPARTIAYEKEIAALRAHGLGLGGSLETVIVYNDEGYTLDLDENKIKNLRAARLWSG